MCTCFNLTCICDVPFTYLLEFYSRFFNQTFSSLLHIGIIHFCVIKILVTGFCLSFVDICCKVFRNISIKHRSKNIVFKIPSIYCPTKFVCNRPYSSMQFFSLLFLFIINCHNFPFLINNISAPIMGCLFIVIMSPHQQLDRQFTIHKEVQILTKKQERRTTNLNDTPLYTN